MYIHDYSTSQLKNKVVGKDHLGSSFVNVAIKLTCPVLKVERMTSSQFCYLVVFGVLTSVELLPSPKEEVAKSLLKYLFGLLSSPVQQLPSP